MPKKSVYEMVTEQIVNMLEKGVCPWRMPWKTSKLKGGLPTNLISNKKYRGINVFLLYATQIEFGWSPYWVSYKQAQQCGGNVRKGEKSTLVVFWKMIDKKDGANETDAADGDSDATTGKRFILRYYRVFNIDQCEGIDHKRVKELQAEAETLETEDHDPIPVCESVVDGYQGKPEIHSDGERAFYRPSDDSVTMPNLNRFNDAEGYYSVLFHELIHSTGHKSRLSRDGITSELAAFGSETYGKEELIAEMGASFLNAVAGISDATIENSAAYLHSWIKTIKGEPKLVVHAAAAAQKAADHILGVKWEE